jgi:hypothetical protein
MKVAYNLTIGTQRAGSTKEQQVRHVDVPFRVFGSVNSMFDLYLEIDGMLTSCRPW